MASEPAVAARSVYPWGGEPATARPASVPPAPIWFSTTTGPRWSERYAPIMRAATSGGPPGPKGTISLIGLSGNLSAAAAAGRPSAIAAARAIGIAANRPNPRANELVIDLSRPKSRNRSIEHGD